MTTATQVRDRTTTYAEDVIAGETVAGRLVRLACERHLRDLDQAEDRGLVWDVAAADRALEFISFLALFEGKHAGQPFILEPWQAFIVGSIFGWKRPNGFRRFRTAYIEAGKGQGKTPMLAAIGLYGLVADGEAGAECVSSAHLGQLMGN